MDQNRSSSILGPMLLMAVLFAFIMYTGNKRAKQEAANQAEQATEQVDTNTRTVDSDSTTLAVADSTAQVPDSLAERQALAMKQAKFGSFAPVMEGQEQRFILENDTVRIEISSKGGQIYEHLIKGKTTYYGEPLLLVDSTFWFDFSFGSNDGKGIHSRDLFFQPETTTDSTLVLRATLAPGSYIEFMYLLKEDSYLVDFDVRFENMEPYLAAASRKSIDFNWSFDAHTQEKDITKERQFSTLLYRNISEKTKRFNPRKDNEKTIDEKLEWVSFKQQFFNITLLTNNESLADAKLKMSSSADDTVVVQTFQASARIDMPLGGQALDMAWLMSPNDLKVFKHHGRELEGILHQRKMENFFLFRWITRGLIIPLFRFLEGFGMGYGLIILIMTLIIKLILSPLTFRAYKSQAKMKVLKPELDELKEKYKDDAQKQQSAQMQLYAKAGVNPAGGCLPMLLQMPFLLAMFYFFPSSIELRGEAFLWANDLSTYDAFFTWGTALPLIGSHISLFTLLMAVSQILSARFNMQMSQSSTQPGMEALKYMPYIFPVFLFFLFNSWASALTYYYFLSNVITVGQQFAIKRFFIDEDKLHEEIKKNKKKPRKKGGFMARLEEAQRLQQQQQKQKGNKKRRK